MQPCGLTERVGGNSLFTYVQSSFAFLEQKIQKTKTYFWSSIRYRFEFFDHVFQQCMKAPVSLNRPLLFLTPYSSLSLSSAFSVAPPAQVCTSIVSPAAPFRQRYYFCATCNIDKASGRAVCETCKDACHAGHRIIEVNGGAKIISILKSPIFSLGDKRHNYSRYVWKLGIFTLCVCVCGDV